MGATPSTCPDTGEMVEGQEVQTDASLQEDKEEIINPFYEPIATATAPAAATTVASYDARENKEDEEAKSLQQQHPSDSVLEEVTSMQTSEDAPSSLTAMTTPLSLPTMTDEQLRVYGTLTGMNRTRYRARFGGFLDTTETSGSCCDHVVERKEEEEEDETKPSANADTNEAQAAAAAVAAVAAVRASARAWQLCDNMTCARTYWRLNHIVLLERFPAFGRVRELKRYVHRLMVEFETVTRRAHPQDVLHLLPAITVQRAEYEALPAATLKATLLRYAYTGERPLVVESDMLNALEAVHRARLASEQFLHTLIAQVRAHLLHHWTAMTIVLQREVAVHNEKLQQSLNAWTCTLLWRPTAATNLQHYVTFLELVASNRSLAFSHRLHPHFRTFLPPLQRTRGIAQTSERRGYKLCKQLIQQCQQYERAHANLQQVVPATMQQLLLAQHPMEQLLSTANDGSQILRLPTLVHALAPDRRMTRDQKLQLGSEVRRYLRHRGLDGSVSDKVSITLSEDDGEAPETFSIFAYRAEHLSLLLPAIAPWVARNLR